MKKYGSTDKGTKPHLNFYNDVDEEEGGSVMQLMALKERQRGANHSIY